MRATHQGRFLSWGILKVEINIFKQDFEVFKRDWKFQKRLLYYFMPTTPRPPPSSPGRKVDVAQLEHVNRSKGRTLAKRKCRERKAKEASIQRTCRAYSTDWSALESAVPKHGRSKLRESKDTVRVSLQEYLFTGSSKATSCGFWQKRARLSDLLEGGLTALQEPTLTVHPIFQLLHPYWIILFFFELIRIRHYITVTLQ